MTSDEIVDELGMPNSNHARDDGVVEWVYANPPAKHEDGVIIGLVIWMNADKVVKFQILRGYEEW